MKRIARLGAVVALAGTAMLGGVTAASANDKALCLSGFACAWEDANFWGLIMNRNTVGTFGFTSLTNDETSSIRNQHANDTQYFIDNVGSAYICLKQNYELSTLSTTWNDEISVMRITSGKTTC